MKRKPFVCVCFLLLACECAAGNQAEAAVTCSANATNMSFGTVSGLNPAATTTGTVSWSCYNDSATSRAYVTLCLNIGNGTGGVSGTTRLMTGSSAPPALRYQLYRNAANTTVWGSELGGANTVPYQRKFRINPRRTVTLSRTVYGKIASGQTTVAPGNYSSLFSAINSAISFQYNDASFTYPATCGGVDSGIYFPFTVSATISKDCTVTAGPTIDLGSVSADQTNISASNAMTVSCTRTTPYFIGLAPSNGNTTGAGLMSGTVGNTDQVPYQLYSNSGLSAIWGNTATESSVGNGVAGTGTGLAQNHTVWVKVNSADYTADTYQDTVTIWVNY
jgi:spore coat protein U-like protein